MQHDQNREQDTLIRREWPRPLAQRWGRVLSSPDPSARIDNLLWFTGLLVRMLASYALADYVTDPPGKRSRKREDPENALPNLSRLSDGGWLNLAHRTLKLIAKRREPAATELLEWLSGEAVDGLKGARALTDLIQRRNEFAHKEAPSGASQTSAKAAAYESQLRAALASMEFMREYRLVSVAAAQPMDAAGAFSGTLHLFIGADSAPEAVQAIWRGWMQQGALYLLDGRAERALQLSPFVEVSESQSSPWEQVFVLKETEKGVLRVVDDEGSQTKDASVPGADYAAWLAARPYPERHVAITDVEGRLSYRPQLSPSTTGGVPRDASSAASRPSQSPRRSGLALFLRVGALVALATVVAFAAAYWPRSVDGPSSPPQAASDGPADSVALPSNAGVPSTTENSIAGQCVSDADCPVGGCIDAMCEAELSPSLWVPGNRWVIRKQWDNASFEHRELEYRYVREVASSMPSPRGGTQIEMNVIGGQTEGATERFRAEGGCLFRVSSDGDESLYWCLPQDVDSWSAQPFLGAETTVATFVSESGYDTHVSATLGWVGFERRLEGATERFVIDGVRVGGVELGLGDLIPPTCDWSSDGHDRGLARSERSAGKAFSGQSDRLEELSVVTRGTTWPQQLAAVTDGEQTYFVTRNGREVTVEGEAYDLAYWVNPEDGVEHIFLFTRTASDWMMAHESSVSDEAVVRRLVTDSDVIDPDPFPTLEGCVIRVRAIPNGGEWSRVADFDVDGGTLVRAGGRLRIE